MPSSHVLQKLKAFFRPSYLGKVWLLTFFVSPLVFDATLIAVHAAPWSDVVRSLPIVLYLIVFGMLLLFPALLLYWVVWWALKYVAAAPGLKKGLLSTVGVFGTWLMYFLFDRAFFAEGGFGVYVWPLSYSVVLTAATFYYPLTGSAARREGEAESKTTVVRIKRAGRNKKA